MLPASARAVLAQAYAHLQPIGEGGMACVFRGVHRATGKTVAIKVLKPVLWADAHARERFVREAQRLACVRHEGIVTAEEGVSDGEVPYYTMEYLDGPSLKAWVGQHGPCEPATAVAIGARLAEALQVVHEAGLVHRDVKCSNIVLTAMGRPVLMDFGASWAAADATLTGTGLTVGTPQYMSPEQAQGLPLDGRSDVFSLGIVLYHILTGARPFSAVSTAAVVYNVVHSDPTPIRVLNVRVPEALAAVVMRCLAKAPAHRFASAQEVADALRASLAAQPEATHTQMARVEPDEVDVAPTITKRVVFGANMPWRWAAVVLFICGSSLASFYMARVMVQTANAAPVLEQIEAPTVPLVLQPLIQQRNAEGVLRGLKSLVQANQVFVAERKEDMLYPERCFVFVVSVQGDVVAVLSPGAEHRHNLLTGKQTSLAQFAGHHLIWTQAM